MNAITDLAALREHVGAVNPLAEAKALPRIDRHVRRFIELSPFVVISTAGPDGVDASPRGDPPGFVRVLDEAALLLPDRPGNRRMDSYANLLADPRIAILFLVPGIDETVRVNGTARITTDPALLEASAMAGRVPARGLLITVEETFFHCGKALIRSRLWDPATRIDRKSFPTLGRIIAEQTGRTTAEEADRNLAEAYAKRLY